MHIQAEQSSAGA